MWPRFKSSLRCHTLVEFVVGSLLCSKRFFSGYSSFPLSSKTNISKFQFDQESGRRKTTLWICYLQIIIIIITLLLSSLSLLCELLDQSNLLLLQSVIQDQSSPLHQRPFQGMKVNSSFITLQYNHDTFVLRSLISFLRLSYSLITYQKHSNDKCLFGTLVIRCHHFPRAACNLCLSGK